MTKLVKKRAESSLFSCAKEQTHSQVLAVHARQIHTLNICTFKKYNDLNGTISVY